MAAYTATATALGSYSSQIVNVTVNPGDSVHVLHGLGATPDLINPVMRSVTVGLSHVTQTVLTTFDQTMAIFTAPADVGDGAFDCYFGRAHSIFR